MNKNFLHYGALAVMSFASIQTFGYTNSECDMAKDLADTGIVYKESNCSGYGLDRTIYRQEVAALALRVAEKCDVIDDIPDLDDYDCENIFYDVTQSRPNSWICRSAEVLANNGILTTSRRDSYGRPFFQPMKDITKAEALSIIMDSGGFDYRGERYDDWRFSGTGAVSWQKPAMQYAEDNDIISSISAFRPNSVAYRREVFSYAQKAIEHCEDLNGGSSSSNSDGDNFYVTTDDSSPDTNDWVDVTVRARDGSSTNDSYRGDVEFEVYYRRDGSSSWTKTTSSSYYEIDEDYEDGYTFKSADDGEKDFDNFIRFKKDDYQYKVVVVDEDDDDIDGYKIFNVGDVSSSSDNEDTDNFYITTTDASPNDNDWVDVTVRARDGSSTDTSYRGSIEFEVYYRTSGSSSWIKTTSSSYYEIDEDYEDGYTFTSSNNGQKTFYDLIRFKKEYEYKIIVVDEDDDDIEGYKTFSVGNADDNDDGDADNFYINTDDSAPDTYDWVDLTVRARDGSSTDTAYRGSVEFEVYYRRSGSSSWTKTTSSSYYEIDEDYEDGYSFSSTNDGQKTFDNFIQFKKDNYEYKVVVVDEDDDDIEGYKIFRVGDYTSSECGLGEYESGDNCYACTGRPSNAYYEVEGSCDWTCNTGYVERNGTCESNSQLCGVGQYANGNSCYSCTTKPSSAYYTSYGTCEWACENGYYRNGDTCVSNTLNCGVGQYANGNSCQSCTTAPVNGYYTTAGSCSWTCNTNYYASGNQCVPYVQNCSVGQYLNGSVCTNCNTKPSHALYSQTGTCDWTCEYGYVREGNSCVVTQSYSWYIGNWGSCSTSCGGGTQSRIVECRSNLGYAVNYWQCAGTMPTTSQSCNTQSCNTYTYSWSTGSWSTCSSGSQTRTVTCLRNDGTTVSNSNCNSGTKPTTTQSCTTGYTYSWKTGNWGTCVNGVKDRTVLCERNDGVIVGNSNCNSGTKPATTQSCTTGSTYSWYRGDVSTCAQTCDETRQVVCRNSAGKTVSDSYCTGTKPDHVCNRALAWVDTDSKDSCNTVCNERNRCWVHDDESQACASGERIPTWGTFNFLFGKISDPKKGGYWVWPHNGAWYCGSTNQSQEPAYRNTTKVIACLCQ